MLYARGTWAPVRPAQGDGFVPGVVTSDRAYRLDGPRFATEQECRRWIGDVLVGAVLVSGQ